MMLMMFEFTRELVARLKTQLGILIQPMHSYSILCILDTLNTKNEPGPFPSTWSVKHQKTSEVFYCVKRAELNAGHPNRPI